MARSKRTRTNGPERQRERALRAVSEAYYRINGCEPGRPEDYLTTVSSRPAVNLAAMLRERLA